jgi:D-serine deaminase-like pyridoxal phosphate-dependent protein
MTVAARASTEAADLRGRLEQATTGLDAPLAAIDLDGFRANAADMARRAGGRPIRLATKSVRARALIRLALEQPGFRGLMAFTLPEALWLAADGFEDVLVAYPTADRAALRALAAPEAERERAAVTLMVDSAEQLDLIDDASGRERPPLRVCLDLDAAYRLPVTGQAIGVRRSPVRTLPQARALAREIASRPGLRLVGVMAYEAQVAGVGDRPAGRPLFGAVLRRVQAASMRELTRRRGEIVAAVREEAELEFVNGGGTGSLERTAADPAVTELAGGSGLYGPHLFDHYGAFRPRPSALFALPVVRRPGPGVVTVLGGGYLASGPGDRLRLPVPALPAGLRLDDREGAGEVQTPLLGAAADELRIGDRVWFRHTKAGELCERFAELHLIEGAAHAGTVPTYRGEGKTFL